MYSTLILQKQVLFKQEVTPLSPELFSVSLHLHSSPSLLDLSLSLSLFLALHVSISLSANTKSLSSRWTAGVCCLFLSAHE